MLVPYIKSMGTRGTKMSANADLITVETYLQQWETINYPYLGIFALNCPDFTMPYSPYVCILPLRLHLCANF